MRLAPDPRYTTKSVLAVLTGTLALALVAGIIHGAIAVFSDADAGNAGIIIWSIAAGLALALWLIVLPISILWIRNLSYEVESDNVIINKGILTKIRQHIPLRMITDFRLNRSLYDRWLGIGSIDIQTAGQSQTATGYEGRLGGLAAWAEIHADLRSRIVAIEPATPLPAGNGELHQLAVDVHHIVELLERDRL